MQKRFLTIVCWILGLAVVPAKTPINAQTDDGTIPEIAYTLTYPEGDTTFSDIFLLRLDGSSEPRRIAPELPSVSQPDWSPDGSSLVFVADGKLHISDLLSGETTQLTDGTDTAYRPQWSPEGSQILFVVHEPINEFSYHLRYKIISINGRDSVDVSPEFVTDQAVWSPNGLHILFTGYRRETDFVGLYLVSLDDVGTANPELLMTEECFCSIGGWSTDSNEVFIAQYGGGRVTTEIMAVNISTHEVRKIGDGAGINYVFGTTFDENTMLVSRTGSLDCLELALINIEKQELADLTSMPLCEHNASFSADKTHIAFVAGLDAVAEVYLMKLKTGEIVQITNHLGRARHPIWRPMPSD